MIQTIQTHRADTNGYLSGNKSKQGDMLDDEDLLDLKIKSLHDYDSSELNLLGSNQNFAKAFSEYELLKLNKLNVSSNNPEDIFKAHNYIITLLQDTIFDISNITKFSISKDLRINYLADMLQDKLLGIYEHSGQLQSLSTTVLTQKNMIQEQKKILYSLSTDLAS